MESVMTKELIKQELIIYVYDYHFLDKENVFNHSNQSITLRKKKQTRHFYKDKNFVDSFVSEFIDNISLSQNGKNVFFNLKTRKLRSDLENDPSHWNNEQETSSKKVKNKNKYELLQFEENSFFIPKQELISYHKNEKHLVKTIETREFLNRNRYTSSYSSIPICQIKWDEEDEHEMRDNELFKW